MLSLEGVIAAWNTTLDLNMFGHALETSFDVNLAYSFLFKLWGFTDGTVKGWAEREKVRVYAALAENPWFNRVEFEQTLGRLRQNTHNLALFINRIVIAWAIIAAVASVLTLWMIPYCRGCAINGRDAASLALFFLGALPLGFIVFCLCHVLVRIVMWRNTRQFNTVIKFYRTQSTPAVLEQYARSLEARLAEYKKQTGEQAAGSDDSAPPTKTDGPAVANAPSTDANG